MKSGRFSSDLKERIAEINGLREERDKQMAKNAFYLVKKGRVSEIMQEEIQNGTKGNLLSAQD